MSTPVLGTIGVEGLAIDCVIGVYPRERKAPQRIVVDFEIDRDIGAAAASDKVRDSIDYVVLADAVSALATERRYAMLERFAVEAVQMLLERFDAERAAIKIMKPGAIEDARCAVVRYEESR